MSERPRLAEALAKAGLPVVAGVSGWLSLATLMVTDDRTLARSAALPPLWWLAAFVIGAVAIAMLTRLSLARAWPLAISLLIWLPFLPFRIPVAFLVWTGPIEWAVWIAVVAGLLRKGPEIPVARAPWITGAITVACAAAAFIAMEGAVPGGDEPHYLIITQSLLQDHDLRIENNHKQGDYKAYFKNQDLSKPDYLVRGKDGEIYPIHPIGVAAWVLPGFAIAGYRGAVATIILSTAAAAGVIWLAAFWFLKPWHADASANAAWFAWAAVFLTTPFFFEEFTIFPDGAGALLASSALLLLVRLETGMETGVAWFGGTGLALALLPWFHTRFAVLAVSAGLVIGVRLVVRRDWSALAAFAVVPVLLAAAWFGYFWMFWGTPNPAAPYAHLTETEWGNIRRGAPGLLFDQQFGLIAQAPVYALAIFGWLSLLRTRTRFAIEWLVLTVPYFLATAAYHMWWGGTSAPARFLTAVMPMAAIPLAWWWAERRTLAPRTLALTLLLLSIVFVIPHAFVRQGAMVFNDRDGFDLLLQWASNHVDLPMAFPGLHRGPEGFMMKETAVWGAAGLLLVLFAGVMARTRIRSAGATWTTIVWAAAIVAMIAGTTVWAMNGNPGVTAGRSQLAVLNDWHRNWQTTALRISPPRTLSADEFERQIEIGSTDRPSTSIAEKDAPTLLRVSFLPAGDYDIVTEGGESLGGELFLWTGKTELPTERWRLEGKRSGFTGLVASFPVAVYSATFRGDPEARASIRKLTLRVRALRVSEFGPQRFAQRAIRYGATRAFFMDDHAYMEGNGFWTRGESATMVVVDTDSGQPAPDVVVQSGPVATSVRLRVGSWTSDVTLNAQERKSVALPASDQHRWPIEITTGAAFRPSDVVQGNGDTRPLGVWIELR